MDAELKKQWTDALRSGKYRQGKKHLRTRGGKYCCLGVLIDGQGKAIAEPQIGDGGNFVHYNYLRQPNVIGDRPIAALIGMNDAGRSFEEIADWIEEHL